MLVHIYEIFAFITSIILFTQIATIFFHQSNAEEANLQYFTFRNITAFFAGLGWGGLILSSLKGISIIPILGISVFCGWTSMIASAAFYYIVFVFKNKSNFDILGEIKGKEATVCKTVPDIKDLGRTGKIDILLQGRVVELNAWNKNRGSIRMGTRVTIKDVINGRAIVEIMDQAALSLADTQYARPIRQTNF